ncbi:hypothetical protein QQ045_007036 [Rhodiola kirilowii]
MTYVTKLEFNILTILHNKKMCYKPTTWVERTKPRCEWRLGTVVALVKGSRRDGGGVRRLFDFHKETGGILQPNADDDDCEDIGEKGIEEPDFDLFVSYDDYQLEGRLGMKWRSGSSGCIGPHDACQNMSAMVLVVFLSVQHCLCENLY